MTPNPLLPSITDLMTWGIIAAVVLVIVTVVVTLVVRRRSRSRPQEGEPHTPTSD